MTKISSLINTEIKRNYRLYPLFIGVLFIISLITNLFQISRFRARVGIISDTVEIFNGVSYGVNILKDNWAIAIVGSFAAVLIVIYTALTWFKDWLGKDKSNIALMSIPYSRFSIVISKIISPLFVIYLLIISQLVAIIVNKQVFYLLCRDLPIIKTSFATDLNVIQGDISIRGIEVTNFMTSQFLNFVVYDIFGLIAIFSMVACLCLSLIAFIKTLKITPIVIGIGVLYLIFWIIYIIDEGDIYNTIMKIGGYALKDIIYFLIVIIATNIASYIMINKKIEV